MRRCFPFSGGGWGGHRRGARPADGGGLRALLPFGRRKKENGWAKRPSGPAGCWADWVKSKGKFLSD
jgi:hypothetical protein